MHRAHPHRKTQLMLEVKANSEMDLHRTRMADSLRANKDSTSRLEQTASRSTGGPQGRAGGPSEAAGRASELRIQPQGL